MSHPRFFEEVPCNSPQRNLLLKVSKAREEERKETLNFSKKKDNVWINRAHWSLRLIHAVLTHIAFMVWL